MASTRQLRYNAILQANLEKIIDDGIRFNLKKLDQCMHNITKFTANNQQNEIKREYMNGRLLIQRLELNLAELQSSYQSMQDADQDKKYEKLIDSLSSEVTGKIQSFSRANASFEKANTNQQLNVQLDDVFQSSNNEPHSNIQIGVQMQQEAAKLTDSKERLQKVEALHQDIEDLNAIAANMASLVGEQQGTINRIENNVTEAADNIEDGTKTLIKASTISVAPITCAALGGAVFGPVGAIVGLKLSTGIMSAFGASAVTYSVAKCIQSWKKEECVQDLENVANISKSASTN